MAYCPKCRVVVDERWIECPACRTAVIPDEKHVRGGEARTLNKPPETGHHMQYGFLDRVEGVIKFDRRVFDSMAIKHPFFELVLLYLAGNLVSYFTQAGTYSGFFGFELLWTGNYFSMMLGAAVLLIGVTLAASAMQLSLKIFGGHESFTTTLFVMLYVSFVWTIAMKAFCLMLGLVLTTTIGYTAASVVIDLATFGFIFMIIAGWVAAFSASHDMTYPSALTGVLGGLALFLALLVGLYMTLSAAVEFITAVHSPL